MNQDSFYAGWKFVTWMVFICCVSLAGYHIVNRTLNTIDQLCGPTTTMEVLVDE